MEAIILNHIHYYMQCKYKVIYPKSQNSKRNNIISTLHTFSKKRYAFKKVQKPGLSSTKSLSNCSYSEVKGHKISPLHSNYLQTNLYSGLKQHLPITILPHLVVPSNSAGQYHTPVDFVVVF